MATQYNHMHMSTYKFATVLDKLLCMSIQHVTEQEKGKHMHAQTANAARGVQRLTRTMQF